MNCIKLHNDYDNSVVIVNLNNISCIDTVINDKRYSKIFLNQAKIAPFCVNETPERVYSIIENVCKQNKIVNNYIKLHNVHDNSVVLIKADAIICADSEIYGAKRISKVYVDIPKVNYYLVNENPEKITSLLNTCIVPIQTPTKKTTKEEMILS